MTSERFAVTIAALGAGLEPGRTARRRRTRNLWPLHPALARTKFKPARVAGRLPERPGTLDLSPIDRVPIDRAEARRQAIERLPETVRALWRDFYRTEQGEGARNGLVCAYQALVNQIVGRFVGRLPRTVERDDLENAGNLGLISAVCSFEPERGIRFEAYAEVRIRGALLDELRTQDWLPRPFRRRFERRKRVLEKLRCELGREPHDDEVAGALGIDPAEYQVLFGTELPGTGSNGVLRSEGGDAASRLEAVEERQEVGPDDRLSDEELLALISESLTEQEFRVLYLRYWQDEPLRVIGEHLSLSESRVSKILARTLERLSERFAAFA